MSAGAPWSVKGINPKAREVAKDLARRSGMTLGEWLNHVILDDDMPEEVSAQAQIGERPFRVGLEPSRLRSLEGGGERGQPELSRVAQALDRLTDRIEASETRTGLAISGVEHSVRHALGRIEAAEREQSAAASSLQGSLQETVERVRRLETDIGPRSAEALRLLQGADVEPSEQLVETVLERLGSRLAAAEARTGAALDELRDSLGALDRRVATVEPGAEGLEQRLQMLGDALAQQVEAVRSDVAQRLAQSGGPQAEARFAQLSDYVRASERRSTQAVEQLGRQVLNVAEAVSRKLADVDQRGADAIDQVGGEVARIAGAVEMRLARAEQTQAEGFQRIGRDLARVTDTLSDRLAASEARATQAIEALSRQFAGAPPVTTPLAPQTTATESVAESPPSPAPDAGADFAAEFGRRSATVTADTWSPFPSFLREKAPVEEVAADLAPAQTTDAAAEDGVSLSEYLREREEALLGPPPEPEAEHELPPPEAPRLPYGAELLARSETEAAAEPRSYDPRSHEPEGPESHETPASFGDGVRAAWRRLDPDAPDAGDETGSFAADFAPISDGEDEDLFETATPEGPQLSTREVIERARAAARTQNRLESAAGPATGTGATPYAFSAKVDRKAASGRLFSGFGFGAKRRNTTLQSALMVAGSAAFLSVSAAGVTLMQQPSKGEAGSRVDVAPRLAVARTSGSGPTGAGRTPPSDDVSGASPVFDRVKLDVEAGRPGALAEITALAEGGDTQARLFLAQLYDQGLSGMPQKPEEARRLTRLAAEDGDVKAMHNYAVYLFRGEGGGQDLPGAVEWFRKAAQGGVIESQYNLGLLYQSGSGVPKDLQEARHWFSEAARQGDEEAQRSLAELDATGRDAAKAPGSTRARVASR